MSNNQLNEKQSTDLLNKIRLIKKLYTLLLLFALVWMVGLDQAGTYWWHLWLLIPGGIFLVCKRKSKCPRCGNSIDLLIQPPPFCSNCGAGLLEAIKNSSK